VWSVGGATAGVSKLLMVTAISFGHPSCQYVNGVPHFEQNVRTTDADDRYSAGDPAMTSNPSLAIVTNPRAWAPDARLQVEQRQRVERSGGLVL